MRDTLLGETNADFDLATAATPDVVRKLFRRTVPVGIEHGTVAVLDQDNTPHEVTTFRRDVRTDGRHAVVEFGASLDEDLARRDFTINAIAYHPINHEWRDPYHGADDIDACLIRAVGDPAARFREDYLRILRALRFAARFGFSIEPRTWEAAKSAADGLKQLSAERVRDEWFKGLRAAKDPAELIGMWEEVGAVGIWLPEIEGAQRTVHGARRKGEAVARLPAGDPVLVTSFLSEHPGSTLRRLRCSNAEIARGERIGQHRGNLPDADSESAVREWLARTEPATNDLLAIADVERPDVSARLRERVDKVRASGAALSIGELAVNGDDLMRAGVPKGPELGRVLRALLQIVLENPSLNSKETLIERARVLLSGSEGGRHSV